MGYNRIYKRFSESRDEFLGSGRGTRDLLYKYFDICSNLKRLVSYRCLLTYLGVSFAVYPLENISDFYIKMIRYTYKHDVIK